MEDPAAADAGVAEVPDRWGPGAELAEEDLGLGVALRRDQLELAVASAMGTRTMSVPCSATICAKAASWTASTAAAPKRVASTRSTAVGVPPRWMWPRIVTLDS